MTDYSDEALIDEIKRVAALVNSPKLSRTEFRKRSRVHPTTIDRRFGGWQQALVAAGCADRLNSSRTLLPHDEVIAELQRVSKELGNQVFGYREFDARARFTARVVRRTFGTWHRAMEAAGLNTNPLGRRYNDDDCFENLLLVWTHYGRAPKHREMSVPPSTVGPKPYVLRFGTWNKALEAFVKRVNADRAETDETQSGSIESSAEPTGPARACDKREIKLGLRYSVLKRDSFRCVICGRSPATHLGVVLHVDHIIPWARGGKTVVDNLRSLCLQCNLGKGSKREEAEQIVNREPR